MFEYPNQFYRYIYGDKKGTCLLFLSPYFWRYIAIIIAIKVIAIRCEPMAIIFTDFSKNLCFSDNSIHTKNSHRHRFIAIIMAIKIIAIRSEPTFKSVLFYSYTRNLINYSSLFIISPINSFDCKIDLLWSNLCLGERVGILGFT